MKIKEIKEYYLNNLEEAQKLKELYFKEICYNNQSIIDFINQQFTSFEYYGYDDCFQIDESIKDKFNVNSNVIFSIDNKHYIFYSFDENSSLGIVVLNVGTFLRNFLSKEDFLSYFNSIEILSDLTDFKFHSDINRISLYNELLPSAGNFLEYLSKKSETVQVELIKHEFNIPFFSISICSDDFPIYKYFLKEEDALSELEFLKSEKIDFYKLKDYV